MAVYLDNAATAPIRPEVVEVFSKHLQVVGNPSAVNSFGQAARRLVEEAREEIAKALNADRNEIIFLSGGTEADNLAVKGLFEARNSPEMARPVVISVATEHHAVIEAVEALEKRGAETWWIPVDERGVLNLVALESFLADRGESVALISAMWANNETGVITDIPALTAIANKYGVPVHSDAVAAFGHIPVDFAASGLAALSVTAHKIGGPVGIGALVVSRATQLGAQIHGGGHERGMRSGTLNASGAKAFGAAATIAVAELDAESARLGRLVEKLVGGVAAIAPEARFSRADAPGLPNNAHFTFAGSSGDSLLFLLDRAGVAVSNGSACQAGVSAASHVLLAMGRDVAEASGCVRVTLGWQSTEADVDAFLAALPQALEGARKAGLPN
jgi:cysteine desulfurase